MSSKQQKLSGYPIPSTYLTTETTQYCIVLPSGVDFRNTAYAQLTMLGKWWLWKHNQDPENPQAKHTAETFRDLFQFLDECSMPIDCDEVEVCLETSPIITNINNEITIVEGDVNTQAGGGYTPSKLPKQLQDFEAYDDFVTPDVVAPENSCDDADKDRLWGFIKSIVFNLDANNTALLNAVINGALSPPEMLERLAVYLPVIGGLTQTAQEALMDIFANTIQAAYESVVTRAFLYDVAEDIFCAAIAGDCTSSLEDIMQYMSDNLDSDPVAEISLVDLFDKLVLQSAGAEFFYNLSWLQLAHVVEDEKFLQNRSITNLFTWAQAQASQGENSWKIYATDCVTPLTDWEIVFDFAGNYVVTGSEIVIRPAQELRVPSLTSQGTGEIADQYGQGEIHTGSSARRRIEFNGTFSTGAVRLNWRRNQSTGTASCDFFPGNGYNFPEFTTTNESFNLTTYRGLGSNTPPDNLVGFEWSAAICNIAQIWLTGFGTPPQF